MVKKRIHKLPTPSTKKPPIAKEPSNDKEQPQATKKTTRKPAAKKKTISQKSSAGPSTKSKSPKPKSVPKSKSTTGAKSKRNPSTRKSSSTKRSPTRASSTKKSTTRKPRTKPEPKSPTREPIAKKEPQKPVHTKVTNPTPRTALEALLENPSPAEQFALKMKAEIESKTSYPERDSLDSIRNNERAALEKFLNIKWSRYIPHKPTPKQLTAMMLANIKEVFFGGALGGGKSDWLAYEALRFCDLPGFSSIIFRRQLTDLKQPGSLIPRIDNWLRPHAAAGHCRYIGDEHVWVFKTIYPGTDIPGPPARLQFGYIGEAAVRERYQSAEYQLVCFDELGQWPTDTDYLFMRSRLRSVVCSIHGSDEEQNPIWDPNCYVCRTLSQIPLRVRAASNPGPAWIKRRFGIIPDPKQFKSRHEAMIAIAEGYKVNWIGTNPSRPFIPSYLDDNPHLAVKNYREMLAEMAPEERSRLEDGNWEARKNARFKRRWQKFFNVYPTYYEMCEFNRDGSVVTSEPTPLPALSYIFTTSDPAVTVKAGPVDDQTANKSSHGVISTWGVTYSNDLLWLDCRKFRKEIPEFVEELVEVNDIWKPRFNKIECNGVGIGVAQYAQAAGLTVRKNYRKTDKLENSLSAQLMMKDGRIYFPMNTTWAEEIEDDVFNWTGLPTEDDDVIDTLADAATEIAPRIAKEISMPQSSTSRPVAVSTVGPRYLQSPSNMHSVNHW